MFVLQSHCRQQKVPAFTQKGGNWTLLPFDPTWAPPFSYQIQIVMLGMSIIHGIAEFSSVGYNISHRQHRETAQLTGCKTRTWESGLVHVDPDGRLCTNINVGCVAEEFWTMSTRITLDFIRYTVNHRDKPFPRQQCTFNSKRAIFDCSIFRAATYRRNI